MRLLLASLLIGTCALAADIATEFSSSAIVPDVLAKAPNELLSVKFNDKEVMFGQELTPTYVKDQPVLSWNSEENAYYLVVMIDPDSPSREDPKLREMLHWMVANVPGSDVAKGEPIAEFLSSAPGKDSGLHRYVQLVYKQPDKLTIDEPRISDHERAGRPGFSIRNFADKYKLGEPLAGNMYQAAYDDYVPIVRKQVGESV